MGDTGVCLLVGAICEKSPDSCLLSGLLLLVGERGCQIPSIPVRLSKIRLMFYEEHVRQTITEVQLLLDGGAKQILEPGEVVKVDLCSVLSAVIDPDSGDDRKTSPRRQPLTGSAICHSELDPESVGCWAEPLALFVRPLKPLAKANDDRSTKKVVIRKSGRTNSIIRHTQTFHFFGRKPRK